MGKRIKSRAIDLSNIQVRQDDYSDDYNPDEDLSGGFSLEELEDLGAISYPKTSKVIPDGEQAFFSAIKQREDF